MKVTRTIPFLLPDDDDLRATVRAFGEVRRRLSAVAFNGGKPLGPMKLHYAAYRSVIGPLSSQLTCSAIRSVAAAYASAKSNKRLGKKPLLFRNDHAIFLIGTPAGRDASFKKDGTLSIWTVNGRKRIAWAVPERLRPLFSQAIRLNSLAVRIDKRNRLVANLAVTIEVPEPVPGDPVGIDLNVTNAVVAVNLRGDVFFETGLATRVRNRRTRKSVRRLQIKRAAKRAVGGQTRSVRRALKRLCRKRSNRTKDFVCGVAKRLVMWAGPKSTLVFEKLDFRKKSKYQMSASMRRDFYQWPRADIRDRVTHKAELVGSVVVLVSPDYTSQTCSVCGNLGERKRHQFSCAMCGCSLHADVNAAINIRRKFTAPARPDGGAKSTAPEARGSSRVSRERKQTALDPCQMSYHEDACSKS